MSRYIEYYEFKDIYKMRSTNDLTPDYYFMAKDKDALNKKNLDYGSLRIWKLDTRNGRVVYERNDHKGCSRDTPVDMDEFYKVVVLSEPCEYSDEYIFRKERESRQAAKK